MLASRRMAGVAAPVNQSLPLIAGGAFQGNALMKLYDGLWTGPPTSYAYQWMQCTSGGASPTPIGGATTSSYTVQAGDIGHTIRLQVTASNYIGSGAALSAASAVVTGPLTLGTYATAVMADQPIVYCRCDDSSGTVATDLTAHENGLYIAGVTLGTAGATSDGDTAVTLDGSTGYLLYPNYTVAPNLAGPSLLQFTSITLEAWVWPDYTSNSNVTCYLIEKHDSSPGSGFALAANAGKMQWRIYYPPANNSHNTQLVSAIVMVHRAWNHVAATFDGTNAAVYHNGASVASGVLTGPLNNSSDDLGGGFSTPNHIQPAFKGVFDELAVYPTALSAGRIAAHYAAR